MTEKIGALLGGAFILLTLVNLSVMLYAAIAPAALGFVKRFVGRCKA